MKIISERLRWINILEQRMISSWVAENVLTEIKILKIEQTNEWLMGQESMAGQLWYWQSRSIKLQDDRMEIIAVEVRNNKESEHPDFFHLKAIKQPMIKRPDCGFTLLEMLLAVVIFSMISFIIYSSLRVTIKSNNIMGNKVQELIRLHRVISLLERDISHSVMYIGSQNDYFSNEGRIIGIGVLDSDSFGIYMLRNNKINTEIFIHYQHERLGYRLKKNCLERLSYLILKNTNKIETKFSCLIEGINDFRVRIFHQGKWLNEWSRIDLSPQGIEIILDVKGVGVIRRFILLLH